MFEELKKLIASEMQIEEEKLTKDAELVNDLGFNSLEVAELIVLIEDKFDVEVDEEVVREFITLKDVADYLETLTLKK